MHRLLLGHNLVKNTTCVTFRRKKYISTKTNLSLKNIGDDESLIIGPREDAGALRIPAQGVDATLVHRQGLHLLHPLQQLSAFCNQNNELRLYGVNRARTFAAVGEAHSILDALTAGQVIQSAEESLGSHLSTWAVRTASQNAAE